MTSDGCTLEEIREILLKLDEEVRVSLPSNDATRRSTNNAIGETYSHPRVAARASRHGLRPGFSIDLATCNNDGEPCDSSKPAMRDKAVTLHEENQPYMSILGPMCGPFGQIQGLNFSKLEPEKVEQKLREGILYLKFSMLMRKRQSDRKRFFMFEHPSRAKSWVIETAK